jgi:hypothetical protein
MRIVNTISLYSILFEQLSNDEVATTSSSGSSSKEAELVGSAVKTATQPVLDDMQKVLKTQNTMRRDVQAVKVAVGAGSSGKSASTNTATITPNTSAPGPGNKSPSTPSSKTPTGASAAVGAKPSGTTPEPVANKPEKTDGKSIIDKMKDVLGLP